MILIPPSPQVLTESPPSYILKTLAIEVSPCPKLLFSVSLSQSSVLSDQKNALICPLFYKKVTEKTHQTIGQCRLQVCVVRLWNT